MFNFDFLKQDKSKGTFAIYTNKKTDKIDVVTYEIDGEALVLKQQGNWLTAKELHKHHKKIAESELKALLKKARHMENIKTVSIPVITKSRFQL